MTNLSHINPGNSGHIFSDSIEHSINIIASEFNLVIDSMQVCFATGTKISSNILIKECAQDISGPTFYIKNCSKTYSIKFIKFIDIIEQKYYNKMESTS